jgi:hypothetical protein
VPAWGFFVYGALYLFAAFVMSGVPVLALGLVLGPLAKGADSTGRMVLVLVVWVGAFVLSWWPFARWVSRRREGARRLFRDGEVIPAVVGTVHHITIRGTPLTRATLTFEAKGRARSAVLSIAGFPKALEPGATISVLFADGGPYAAGFVDGRAIAAKVAAA